MNKTCNPLQRNGERSVFCSYYKGCLDHAVKRSWPCWDCGDCRHKLDQGSIPEIKFTAGDSIGYYDLRLTSHVSAALFGLVCADPTAVTCVSFPKVTAIVT
jgi:hypothetical protein